MPTNCRLRVSWNRGQVELEGGQANKGTQLERKQWLGFHNDRSVSRPRLRPYIGGEAEAFVVYKYTTSGHVGPFLILLQVILYLQLLLGPQVLRLHGLCNLRVHGSSTPWIPVNVNQGYTRNMPVWHTHVSSARDFIRVV